MTNLLPLVPFLSGKSCEEGTRVLVGFLGEALEAQEAATVRVDKLKQLKPKGLMELFKPEGGAVNGSGKSATPAVGNEQRQPPPPTTSPKKAQAPQKRARKVSQKAAAVDVDEDEVKKPKKQSKSSLKNGGGAWNGVEYPRITKVTKCDEGEDGLRLEVHAKKQGRGQWQEMRFLLDSTQLRGIDNFPHATKTIVTDSFHKAATGLFGRKWPSALRLALAGTTWAKDILPAAAEGGPEANNGSGMFMGLGGLNVDVSSI